MHAVLGLMAAISLLSCQPSLEEPPLRVESGTCRIRSTVPVELPTRLAAEMCEASNELRAVLELPARPTAIDYSLFLAHPQSQLFCGDASIPFAVACFSRGTVRTSDPFHLHELVHATLIPAGLRGTAALQEGAAEVFSCRPGTTDVLPSLPLERFAGSRAFYIGGSGGYTPAASFVSFLLDRAGPATFAELLAATDDRTSLAGLDRATRRLYGEPIADLHAAWQAEGPQPLHRICRPFYPCSAPELGDEPTLTLVRGLTSGLISHAGAVRTFSVETAGELHVEAYGPSVSVSVVSCERGPDVMVVEQESHRLDDRAPIEPGRYALRLTARLLEGDQTEVEAELRVRVE